MSGGEDGSVGDDGGGGGGGGEERWRPVERDTKKHDGHRFFQLAVTKITANL